MTKEERLRGAIEVGQRLKVIYHGGSQPGAIREISPIDVQGGKVRARCYTSNAVKTFVLEKIEIIDGEPPPEVNKWSPESSAPPDYISLEEFLQNSRSVLEEGGWHVEFNRDSISLYRRFKNGKLRKTPDVSINYEEYTLDLIVGEDGHLYEEVGAKRQRPWIVRGKNKTTKTLGNLGKASQVFLSWAEEFAPNCPL